jgi:hypothetical protein
MYVGKELNNEGQLFFVNYFIPMAIGRGYAVTHFFQALCYKQEGRGFDSPIRSEFFFRFVESFQTHYGPVVDSTSNRNQYQKM